MKIQGVEKIVAGGLLLAVAACGPKEESKGSLREKGASEVGVETDRGRQWVIKKLESIVIPNVAFEAVSMEDAIEFVRMRMAELDPELDSAKKGISFVVRYPQKHGLETDFNNSLKMGESDIEETIPLISLKEVDIKAMDLLIKCAELAEMNFYLTSRGLVMIPEGERLNPEIEREQGIEIWKVYREAEE